MRLIGGSGYIYPRGARGADASGTIRFLEVGIVVGRAPSIVAGTFSCAIIAETVSTA